MSESKGETAARTPIPSSCPHLTPPSASYAAQVRAASEARRQLMQSRIRTLHPGVCANVAPFLFLATLWLLWTVAAPLALLLVVRAHPDATHVTAMRVVGWTLLGTGCAYLARAVVPILTLGGCCMPTPPENDGPFLKQAQRLCDEPRDAPPKDAHATSAPFTLQPQASIEQTVEGRCVYILVNSFGSHGSAALSKARTCHDALRARGCCVHQLESQYAGHFADLGRDPVLLPLESALHGDSATGKADLASGSRRVGAVLLVGGDGTFSEFINGYMERCAALDIPPTSRTPLGLIPGGSGNSLARDLYSGDLSVQHAIDAVLAGRTRRIDVCALTDSVGLRMYSTNVVSYGLVGDTAVVAEDYRALGDLRYDVCAVWFVLRKVTAGVRFALTGLAGEFNYARGRRMNLTAAPNGPGEVAAVGLPSSTAMELSGRKTTAFFSLTQHFAKALRSCPHAKLDDGLIDVVVCEAATRSQLLTMFQQLPRGAHLTNRAISHFQVQQAEVTRMHEEADDSLADVASEPDSAAERAQLGRAGRSTIINIDGENVCVTGTVTIRARLRQIPVFVADVDNRS